MKKILVTGGSGFIGTNFINRLLLKNYIVYNIDKLSNVSTPEKFKVIKNKKKYQFYKINILDEKKLKKKIDFIKPDIIFNFAAESHVDRSIDNPKPFIENNILSSLNIFNIFKEFSIKKPSCFLFHISTDEVFGSNTKIPSLESANYKPSSPYSSSKASTDLIALSFVETYKLPIKILNLCNNFGPYQYLEKLIPTIIFKLIHNKKIPLYGDGKNIREWMFVDDCCDAIIMLINKKLKHSRYNIGSGYRINNILLAKKIHNIIFKLNLTTLNKKDFYHFVDDRPGHDHRYALNSDLFYSETKFKMKHNIDSGLIKTIKWYLNNKDWVEYAKKSFSNKRIGLNDK